MAVALVRNWREDIFDCCKDPGLCVKATVCPCIMYGEAVHRFDGSNKWCNCLLCAYSTYGRGSVLGALRRQAMRKRFKIHGDLVADFAYHFFCYPCAYVQEERELDFVAKDGTAQAMAIQGSAEIAAAGR